MRLYGAAHCYSVRVLSWTLGLPQLGRQLVGISTNYYRSLSLVMKHVGGSVGNKKVGSSMPGHFVINTSGTNIHSYREP